MRQVNPIAQSMGAVKARKALPPSWNRWYRSDFLLEEECECDVAHKMLRKVAIYQRLDGKSKSEMQNRS